MFFSSLALKILSLLPEERSESHATGPGPKACSPGSSTSTTQVTTTGKCGAKTGWSVSTGRPAPPGMTRPRLPIPIRQTHQGLRLEPDPDASTPLAIALTMSTSGTSGEDGPHHWDQLYLKRIRYADYTENGATKFLVSVTFVYEDRPDPFSEYRSGFEIRTRQAVHADRDSHPR